MSRYVLTALAIGTSAMAVVLALYFFGAFGALTAWLSELYTTRSVFTTEGVSHLRWLEVVVIIIASLGVAWCVVDVSQVAQKILVYGAISLIVFGVSPALAGYNFLFEPFSSLTAVLLAAAGGFIFAGTERGMRKRVLEGVLGHRVSSGTFNELMDADDPPDFTGRVRQVTVLSCRFFNHGELRSQLESPELMKMSNLFLRSVSNFLMSRGGYLDESGPESVRVFFGMLKPSDDHALQACRAAIELRSRLRNLSQEAETRWFHKLEFGVGVSSGEMTVGVYGTRQRFFFSGIGSEIDYSRRLAQANKRYRSDLLVGPITYDLVKDEFEVRPMEMFYDPESDLMTEVYQLLAAKENFTEEEAARRDLFWQGVIYLRSQKYDEALDHFSRSRLPGAEDRPVDFFIEKSQEGMFAPEGSETGNIRSVSEKGHARLISLM